ncbi:MAG: ABC transporter substrate-binding protein [Hyphomicrobiales bacterium]|nr:ABC transporter substrate-binding protein [Hyphomicrobiales bacterium]
MAARRPKLGFLALTGADSIDLLLETLGQMGWANGMTYDVVIPKPTQDLRRLEGNMRELLDARVDVIVAQTKPAIVIAQRATATLPIVMGALNGDPVKEGFVQSLERPGGNITGSYYNVASGADSRVGVLMELVPGLKRIGIVFVPDSEASQRLFDELAAAATGRGLEIVPMPVRGGHEVDAAFATAKAAGVEGVVTVTAAEMFAIRRDVAQAQLAHRLPAVMGSIGYPELGGLAKFGPEVPSLWKAMAPTVDALLRGAAPPAELPLVTVDGFQLDLNLKTARTLGLTVPEPLLRRAVRVVRDDR